MPCNLKSKIVAVDLRKGNIYPLAARSYQKAIKLHPDDSALYFGLARVYGKIAEYEKSVKCLKKCLPLKPDCQKALEYLDHTSSRSKDSARKTQIPERNNIIERLNASKFILIAAMPGYVFPPRVVMASSNDTLCFPRFFFAFSLFHSNCICSVVS
ncbi:MAG: tetratricopeptide repeat protein [Nitrospinae bacterium]|nr:tetratricopeptide repeat protein [Nitrospinota bacterium]